MKAKPRLQYRLQDTGAARNMKLLVRKLQALNIPKKEVMYVFVRLERPWKKASPNQLEAAIANTL